MPQVLDIEQAVLLLEIEPPFDKRDIQLARRRQAKRWHPDIAPPGRQLQHERHLKAVNEAADQLERLAEQSRGGKVTRNAVKVSAAAARKRRAEEGARAYAEEQRQRAAAADQQRHDPFGSRVPDHSVVHRYARCLSYPEWGVGSVNGIYFTGDGDDIQQWARVSFNQGIRTVPAGSLQFVDFTRPDPGAERVERFMTAAKHALAEGNFALAARRLVYARDAEPRNTAVLRLLTTAFWQAGDYSAAARAVRDWIREEGERPAPYRTAARIYEDMGSLTQALDAAEREVERAPRDGSAWERLGRLRLRRFDRAGAREALERARAIAPTRAGPARPRAGRAPGRRHRRGGLRVRAGGRAGAGLRGRLGAAGARARADRPHGGVPGRVRARARPRRRSGGPRPARAGAGDGAARAGERVRGVATSAQPRHSARRAARKRRSGSFVASSSARSYAAAASSRRPTWRSRSARVECSRW